MDSQATIREDDKLEEGIVLLIEWQDAPKVKQIISIEERPFDVYGLKPNRIITAGHKVLCQYDASVDNIDFSPLQEMEGAWVASVSAPSPENSGFHWFLQRIGAFIDNANIHLVFGRVASEEEASFLDAIFPKWREGMAALGEGEAQA